MIDDEALGDDAGYRQEHQPFSAKSYPIWIIGFGLLVLLAFGYSSLSLPRHVSQAWTLARADRLDQAGDYVQAEREYRTLLVGDSGSEAGRLGMAHAIFADSDSKNDPAGLALLQGMRLDKYDWRRLQPVMPLEYEKLFAEQEQH
jgi:hypothetical protein